MESSRMTIIINTVMHSWMHIQADKQTPYFTSYNAINNGPIMGCMDQYDDFSKHITIFLWESEN